ncbi:hypothetical protein [Stutzerimonas stutzeri]|uniref:hypothetical protein n=1 Tax=Stutzerimonas stutzeri TaxID=316 RepID=UPI003DA085C6
MNDLFYPVPEPMPYESILSIYLKLSHANFIGLPSLGRVLGNECLNMRRIWQWFQPDSIDTIKLKFPELEKHLPWNYAPFEGLADLGRGIVFCPYCIRFGYHSVFNLVEWHKVCVLHKCHLLVACSLCSDNYLRGFQAGKPIPQITSRCRECGFYDIGLVREIKMRRSKGLDRALQRFGEAQASWYTQVKRTHKEGSIHGAYYYKFSGCRQGFTAPFERAFRMQSPERIAKIRRDDQPIAWVKLPSFSEAGSWGKYECRIDNIQEACEGLESSYLSGHRSCVASINTVTSYSDGTEKKAKLCPVALSYILLRLKLAYLNWPVPGSISALSSGFAYAEDVIPLLSPEWNYRELRVAYLSILGRLQLQVSEGKEFLILCRFGISLPWRYRSLDFIRKSSYGFRTLCRTPTCTLEIYRDGFGGPLLIRPDSDSSESETKTVIERLVI